MTLRPHCLQCGSASVIRDDDVLNGRTSVYCAMCGNRQYKGTDYIGFEMKEASMTIRAICKNCKRPGMTIINKGFCFTCAKVSGANPGPGPERDKAMAEVAEKAKNLPGPHQNKKESSSVGRSIIRKRSAASPKSVKAKELTEQVASASTPAQDKITVQVTFSGVDVPLYRTFQDYCHRKRRDPEGQILFLIDDIVRADKALMSSLGVQP